MLPLLAGASPRPELRPYQIEAVDGIFSRFDAGDRATLLVLCTGGGKTQIFCEVARRFAIEGKRSLILAHRTELVEQAITRLETFGLDVGMEQAGSKAGAQTVVVASVQTLQRERLKRWAPDHFGLVVADEGHHSVADSYRNIIDHFASAKLLGVTATPDRADKKGLHSLFDSVAYRYEIDAGIRDGWLVPLTAQRILVEGLDLSAVRTTAGDLNQGDLDLAMRHPAAVSGVAEPLVNLTGDRKTIVFAVTVEHAHVLADAVNALSHGTAMALDGTASREHRADVLRRYHSGEIRMLINCSLYTEGFDAPATACIAIARPTKSRSLYAQMIGRGTRTAEGKQDCAILDFAGIAGKHSLIGPADVLAGKDLDAETRAIAEEMLEAGGQIDLFKLLDEATQEARQRHQKRTPDPIAWTALEVELFGDSLDGFRKEWAGLPITERQAEYLERKGIDIERLDKASASALITALKARQTENLCTFKQAKTLGRYGIDTAALSFDGASKLIDEIVKQKWRPTQLWLENARRRTRG